jgi:alpha-beta hydrolase superfamily lysophospholipase
MRPVAVLILALVATACTSYPGDITRETLSPRQLSALDNAELGLSWRQQQNAIAVVVLIHGLNLDPAAMLDIQASLFDAGMDVLSLSLTGHGNALDDEGRLLQFQEATFVHWQADVQRAVQAAARHATALSRPLHLVGFSLGGLLSADYLVQSALRGGSVEVPDINRMVLLAPAITLKWSSYLLYPLQIFPDIYLPSVAPRVYRANDYAPVSAYFALYEGVNQFNELAGQPDNRQALNIPALVFMHPRDELVSANGVREFISEHQLSQWQFVEVDKSEDAADVLNHLIIGPHSLGSDAWRSVSTQLLDFLRME